MNNVIDINKNTPHGTGQTICWSCQKVWQAVFPIGTDKLDCDCGKKTFVPPVDDASLEAFMMNGLHSAESDLFYIANNGVETHEGQQVVRNWQKGMNARILIAGWYIDARDIAEDLS